MIRLNFISAVISLLICSGCVAVAVSSEAIDAKVVDATTGAPLDNAVVVAYWGIKGGNLTGDSLPCGSIVEEAVTDKEGNFHLPGWAQLPGCNGMIESGSDPMLIIYRAGYKHGGFSNFGPLDPTFRTFDWLQHSSLKLEPLVNSDLHGMAKGSYFDEFQKLNSSLDFFTIFRLRDCNWTKMPNMMRALLLQEMAFSAARNPSPGIATNLANSDDEIKRKTKCGSPKEYFSKLLAIAPNSTQ